MEKNTLSKIQTCVEKTTTKHSNVLKHIRAQNPVDRKRLSAAFYESKLWPSNKSLKVAYMTDPDTSGISRTEVEYGQGPVDPIVEKVKGMNIKDAIKLIVKERIEPMVNLKFTFIDNPNEAEIRISFDESDGAWALLGNDALDTQKDEPTMNLGWFNVPTTIHEFGHVLGMIHEHQNTQGHPIQWNKQKVYKWAKQTQGWDDDTINTNIFSKYSSDQVNGSDFDPLSIMLYFFPPSLTTNGVGTRQNNRLSADDILWISKKYKNDTFVASEFYKGIYSEDIENGIRQIADARLKFMQGNNTKNLREYGIYLLVLIWVGICVFIIYRMNKKKKD